MSHFQSHPDFYNHPIRLGKEQKTAPLEILRDFFDNCPLSTLRQTLWNMVETSLAVPYSVYDTAGERQYLLWFYRELETVLEAGWLLSRQNNNCH
jgi:hypothetical protein